MKSCFLLLFIGMLGLCCQKPPSDTEDASSDDYPSEIIDFTPYDKNPVFSGTGADTWDQKIRERGYILRDDDTWHMWYTGYQEGPGEVMHLGYATSPDGLVWERYQDEPIFDLSWTEDMMVIKVDDVYHMFAEGRDDIAHRLTSTDRINWEDHGSLDIRQVDGSPLSPGPYGTPTIWLEDNTWYLFYERNDQGIWLATSTDLQVWTNVQDAPVLKMGPEAYDTYGLAVNQVLKHKGKYYAYYHGTAFEDWHEWTTNVAISEDLIHWEKYAHNPIMKDNKSSGILVHDGTQYRLYTMHPKVQVHFPQEKR